MSDVTEKLQASLYEIIDIARHAPSVHNSQPWQVKQKGSALIITIDKAQMLKDGDPTGRETYISLGIFTEAIILAAHYKSLHPKTVKLQNQSVSLELTSSSEPQKADREGVRLLLQRCTDRSIYRPVKITKAMSDTIIKASDFPGVKIFVRNDNKLIHQVADLTARGIGVALSNPSFRAELSQYLVLPWSKKKRGISVDSLQIPRLLAIMEPWLMRFGIGLQTEARLERRRWESSSAIVFITTRGDMQKDWFAAGRAYLRVALAIESLGLSQATSAATVEAATFHEEVESLLDTRQRLQSVMRIGAGSTKKAFSPRLPAGAIITSTPSLD